MSSEDVQPYHHGALRQVVIDAAVREVEAHGANAVSLRQIARAAGVSATAPQYHFGDKAGLFTAIATEGFRRSEAAIGPHATGRYGFLDGGVAYVGFAITNPGYFEVMFRPALYRTDDPELITAKQAAFRVLNGSGAALAAEWGLQNAEGIVLAGWSLAHGLATLLLTGNLDDRVAQDPDLIRRHLSDGLAGLGYVSQHRENESDVATDR